MDDLFKPAEIKKNSEGKKSLKKEKEGPNGGAKEYHNIFMSKAAIELLDKVTLTCKLEDKKFTKGDAVYEGIKLLAKEKGIKP